MTIYPVEFHRRLEQKWASRIEQILTDVATLPRNPSDDDDDEEEDEDEDDTSPTNRRSSATRRRLAPRDGYRTT
jgi:hypothetical protein